MSSTITDSTTHVEIASLEDVLSKHPRSPVQVNLSLAVSGKPESWMMKLKATATAGNRAYVHQSRFDPAQNTTPYDVLGAAFGVDKDHPFYAAVNQPGIFPVILLTDWIADAQLQLVMRGIDAHVDIDISGDTEYIAPNTDPLYKGTPPY